MKTELNNLDFLNDLLHDEDFITAVLCPHLKAAIPGSKHIIRLC